MNFQKICVYDFETDSANPRTCNPVQLGAIIINPRTLTVETDSEFNSGICPEDLLKDEKQYIQDHSDTIAWHSRVQNCTSEQIIEKWKSYPLEKDVYKNFKDYLLKYHTRTKRQCKFSAPMKAGYNIIRFDNIIIERLCKKYGDVEKSGDMTLFHPRDQIDAMMLVFNWFENLPDLKSYSMDTLRPYFGINSEGAHDALQDVKDTAELIIRFLKLHRRYAEKVNFKGSFNGN